MKRDMSFRTPVMMLPSSSKRRLHDGHSETRRESKTYTLTLTEKKEWRCLAAPLDLLEWEDRAKEISSLRGPLDWNFLHVLCSLAAPLSIIRRVANVCPDLVSEVDVLGRTPLHIALCFFAPGMDVIVAYLGTANKAALSIQDIQGKTPLTYACDNSGNRDIPLTANMHCRLIKNLVRAEPLTISVEDHEGISPIEHAVCSNAPFIVVEMLQMYSMYMGRKALKDKRRPAVKPNKVDQ